MAEPAMKGSVEQKNIDQLAKPLVKEFNDSGTGSGEEYETKIDP